MPGPTPNCGDAIVSSESDRTILKNISRQGTFGYQPNPSNSICPRRFLSRSTCRKCEASQRDLGDGISSSRERSRTQCESR